MLSCCDTLYPVTCVAFCMLSALIGKLLLLLPFVWCLRLLLPVLHGCMLSVIPGNLLLPLNFVCCIGCLATYYLYYMAAYCLFHVVTWYCILYAVFVIGLPVLPGYVWFNHCNSCPLNSAMLDGCKEASFP